MTAVHSRSVRLARTLLVLLLLPLPGATRPKPSAAVPPPPGPVIIALEAIPAPDLKSISARAVIRSDRLAGSAVVSLSVGASTAWAKVEPGAGDVTIERMIPLTRVKAWTPGRPVRFLLIAALTRQSVALDRRGVRFALRTLELPGGRLRLNGMPFQVRGIAPASGSATSAAGLKSLRTAGYNAILLPPSDRTPVSYDACDAAGLLALDEVPAPGPALVRLVPAASPAPDPRALAVFGSSTGFTEAARRLLAERYEHALSVIRQDSSHPGFLVQATPPPDLGGRFSDRSLAIMPPPALANAATEHTATVWLGAGPWPGDTMLEWHRNDGENGTGSGWLPLPRGRGISPHAIRLLSLPPSGRPGRWTVEVHARSGRRVLASATATWRTAEFREVSQFSFAIAGNAPAIRAAYGSWIIPAEFATVVVIVRPASLPTTELISLLQMMVRGKTLIFLGLDTADAAVLTALPEGCWTLVPAPVNPLGPSHLTWVRPDRFGVKLPGTGITEPGLWFAGLPFDPMLPTLSLHSLPGATVWAGESPLDPDQPPLASVMTIAAGAGHAVFCQWRIQESLPDPLTKRVFERLLGL